MERNVEWELKEEVYHKLSRIPYVPWYDIATELIEKYTTGGPDETYEIMTGDRGTKASNVEFRIDLQEYCTVLEKPYANFQIQINKTGEKILSAKNIKVPDKSSVALVLIPVNEKIPFDRVQEAFKISCLSGKLEGDPKRKVTIIHRRA